MRMTIMARYFFHIRSPDAFIADDEGGDFKTLQAARDYAVRAARDIMRDALRKGVLPLSFAFEIADAFGSLSLAVPFAQSIEVR